MIVKALIWTLLFLFGKSNGDDATFLKETSSQIDTYDDDLYGGRNSDFSNDFKDSLMITKVFDDVQNDDFNNAAEVIFSDVRSDALDVTLENKKLIRRKRNFGGSEAINFPLVYDSIFGVKGWLASGIEVFQDILFHVSGYTVLGKKNGPTKASLFIFDSCPVSQFNDQLPIMLSLVLI